MPRLPQPGKDAGQWGDILNEYLSTSISSDGTLKTDTVGAAQLKPSSVTHAALAPNAVTKADIGLSNVDNTSDLDKPISNAQQAKFDTTLDEARIGVANGVASLDGDARLAESQLPDRLSVANVNNTIHTQAVDASGRRIDGMQLAQIAPYSIRPGVKAVFLGDSITNGSTAAADRRWIDQLPRILGTGVISANSVEEGNPGETSANMLARYATSVRAHGAQILFLLAGTNDAGQGRTLAEYASSIKGIVAEAQKDGVPVIIGTVPPLGSSRPAADKLRVQQYNTWLAAWCPTVGVTVAEVFKGLVANGTDSLQSGYDADGIHPETLGHQKIAEAFAAAYTARFGTPALHPVQSVSAFNLVTNGLFFSDFGSGWFNPGGGTGATPTVSVEADSTGKLLSGQWGKITLDASSQASSIRRSFSITGLSPGDKLLVTARTHVTDVNGGILAAMQGGNPSADASLRITRPNLTTIQNLNGPSAVLNSGPIMRIVTVPAGETQVYITAFFSLPAGQSGALRIGEVGVFNVTNLPDIATLYT